MPPGTTQTGTTLFVEGVSDRVALEVLARRRGLDLAAAGVRVVAMQGVTNLGHFLAGHAAESSGRRIGGLYDEAEEHFVVHALTRAGHVRPAGQADRPWLESLGFYCCSADLEDELIRALGTEAVEGLVAAEGQLRSFRTLQKQPALRARPLTHQLRRLMSGRTGGKERYAAAMAEAVPLDLAPRPLTHVLAHAAAS